MQIKYIYMIKSISYIRLTNDRVRFVVNFIFFDYQNKYNAYKLNMHSGKKLGTENVSITTKRLQLIKSNRNSFG